MKGVTLITFVVFIFMLAISLVALHLVVYSMAGQWLYQLDWDGGEDASAFLLFVIAAVFSGYMSHYFDKDLRSK